MRLALERRDDAIGDDHQRAEQPKRPGAIDLEPLPHQPAAADLGQAGQGEQGHGAEDLGHDWAVRTVRLRAGSIAAASGVMGRMVESPAMCARCTAGQGTEPYEQYTQQSPAFGRSCSPHRGQIE